MYSKYHDENRDDKDIKEKWSASSVSISIIIALVVIGVLSWFMISRYNSNNCSVHPTFGQRIMCIF